MSLPCTPRHAAPRCRCCTAASSRPASSSRPAAVRQRALPAPAAAHAPAAHAHTQPTSTDAAPADTPAAADHQAAATAAAAPRRVLTALGNYAPTGLSDGPASLAKVWPYNAAEVQLALDASTQQQLEQQQLAQLANLAAALAAAGHHDAAFMTLLGDVAAAKLAAAAVVQEHKAGLAAFRAITWLAVGFARLGVLHVGLMEQVALRGAALLLRRPMAFSKAAHGTQLALLAGAFASLQLYPPKLYRAIGEHLKQQRYVLRLLGPQESMLLLWSFAKVGHSDPAAQLLVTQRAATQVGQLDCQGLAHAYAQCAAAGIASPPLLAALRKSLRQRLQSLQPGELTAVLLALAVLQQQDLLFFDELARAVHNKAANFAAAELSSAVAALAALRYRNPWLLERVAKILVSRRLNKAQFLMPAEVASLVQSCGQLQYRNALLLSHLATVAAAVQVPRCSAQQLEALLAAFARALFWQPQLLQAGAARLLQLATAQQQQQQQQQQLSHLLGAAYHLATLPSPTGSTAEKLVLPAAMLAIAAQAVGQQQTISCADAARLCTALLCLTGGGGSQPDAAGSAPQQQPEPAPLLSGVLQQLLPLQQAAQQQLTQAASQQQPLGAETFEAMQLMWLGAAAAASTATRGAWQLGLPADAVDAFLAQQQQQSVLQAVRTGLLQVVPRRQEADADRGAAGVRVQAGHRIPGSPIVLPLAVLWGGEQQQQQQGLPEGSAAAQPEGFLEAAVVLQQERHQRRMVQLPGSVRPFLEACAAANRPVAVFVQQQQQQDDDDARPAWVTANAPRRAMPAARLLWRTGLAAAGWGVLVLLLEEKEQEDQEEGQEREAVDGGG